MVPLLVSVSALVPLPFSALSCALCPMTLIVPAFVKSVELRRPVLAWRSIVIPAGTLPERPCSPEPASVSILPCAPVAGPGMGVFVAPPAGAQVWLQFEAGDPERPVWVGGYWSSPAELPPAALAGADIVLQSSLQNGLVISDLPGPAGGLLLRSASGATIRVTDTGIAIENGQGASIVLSGPTVTINGGALEIV